MLKVSGKLALVVLVIVSIAFVDAYACRIIRPRPWPIVRPPRPRPVRPRAILTKYHSADINIKDQVAEVTVNATFYNPNPFRMEGTYWFPLPAEAAVSEFQMVINGKRVRGELLDANRARTIYEDIVRKQRDPALLEWIGSQMLKCRIFPMEANKETKVTLTYTHMLKEDAGLVRLNYPLRSAKPNAGTIDRLTVRVSIESRVALKTVYSPTQSFDVSRKSDNRAVLTYEATNADPARDVQVIFSRARSDVGLSIISHKPADKRGYFLLTVTPKVKAEASRVIRKDVIFVFDTSGSMAGERKIEQAKKALQYCINSLNKGDRFNIIAFSGEVRRFSKTLLDRTDANVAKAEQYISSLTAVGGTALNDALLDALDVAKTATNVPMIIFLTDGHPTIGEQNVKTILKNVRGANAKKCRLFVFGVGYDVNTKLLDLVAEENRGVREYVKPKEDIEVKVSAFYTKIANPVLSDVTVRFGDAEVEQTYPRRLPDLFHGSQLTMLGRFRKPGDCTVTLSGRVGDEARMFTYDVVFKGTKSDGYLPRLWALRKVAFLLDEIRLRGEKKEIIDEVTRLGKLHGIVTPYTSFLVIEEGAPITTAMRRELEEAGKVAREGFGRRSDGRGAVADSANLARAKGSTGGMPQASAPGMALGIHGGGKGGYRSGAAGEKAATEFDRRLRSIISKTIRQVDDKTFYVKADGTWVDSTYDKANEARIKQIALWSDAFFALLRAHPELGRYVADSQKLIVCLGKEIYRIQ